MQHLIIQSTTDFVDSPNPRIIQKTVWTISPRLRRVLEAHDKRIDASNYDQAVIMRKHRLEQRYENGNGSFLADIMRFGSATTRRIIKDWAPH